MDLEIEIENTGDQDILRIIVKDLDLPHVITGRKTGRIIDIVTFNFYETDPAYIMDLLQDRYPGINLGDLESKIIEKI